VLTATHTAYAAGPGQIAGQQQQQQQLSQQQAQLATTLANAVAAEDQINTQIQQNQQQQNQLQAQIAGYQAQIQQLDAQTSALQTKIDNLTREEASEKKQLQILAGAMYAQPSSALVGIVEASNVGDYLTQDAQMKAAGDQARQLELQIDTTRKQTVAAQTALTDKRTQVQNTENQVQASLNQMVALGNQQVAAKQQLNSQIGVTQAAIAQANAEAAALSAQLAQETQADLSQIGAGGSDAQAIQAGVAAGLYKISGSGGAKWPATPDPTPLGLAAYPGYCVYQPIQCTCYAANAYTAFTGGHLPQNLGNGGQWYADARQDGIPTSQSPVEGAVVSFSGGEYSGYGHVAIVRSVLTAGSQPVAIVVWERNMDLAGGFDTRIVTLGPGSAIAGFILPGYSPNS
jgi:predicted  nucleic acid-binding Zn-ribbon protein